MRTAEPITDGFTAPGWEDVRGVFADSVARYGNAGAAVCVYHHGRPTVSLAAGMADTAACRQYTCETIQPFMSVGKGILAIAASMLADWGAIDIDAPVASYWPEFAQAGKGAIPVRWLLTHQAGLAALDEPVTREELLSWTPVIEALERQRPNWPPGTAHGYHSATYGFLVGEVIRLVTGQLPGPWIAEHVSEPLGAEVYLGLPERLRGTAARVLPFKRPQGQSTTLRMDVRSLPYRAALGFTDPPLNPLEVNDPAFQAAQFPAANGVGSARGLARIFAAVIGEVDGVRLMSRAAVDRARREQVRGPDLAAAAIAESALGLGFNLPTAERPLGGPGSFGTVGLGGCRAWALPEAGLSFAYLPLQLLDANPDPRELALSAAVLKAAAALPPREATALTGHEPDHQAPGEGSQGRAGRHPVIAGFGCRPQTHAATRRYRGDMEQALRERYRAAHDSITRLASAGLADDELLSEVARELGKAVAYRGGGWMRLDPQTMLPMPGLLLRAEHDRARALLHGEYFGQDFLKIRELARRPVPVDTLRRATGGDLALSTRYRTILAGLGYGDELRAVFRYGDGAWGAACLPRSATDPPFSEQDVAFVARVCEPVARGLRMSHLLAAAGTAVGPADPEPPGVLVIADDDSVVSQTSAARHWLSQLPPEQASGLDLPLPVLAAASAARAGGNPGKSGLVRTCDGRWLRLEAARLTPPAGTSPAGHAGQTAVVIAPAGAAELSPLVLELHELTSREREITQLLLRGLPTSDIARDLFISRHTLGDHVKSIFAKLGVSSRPELTALLLGHALGGHAD